MAIEMFQSNEAIDHMLGSGSDCVTNDASLQWYQEVMCEIGHVCVP